MECSNHSDVRLRFDVHNQEMQTKSPLHVTVLWAYFTNGPNAAASIAPTLIRHWRHGCWVIDVPGGQAQRHTKHVKHLTSSCCFRGGGEAIVRDGH